MSFITNTNPFTITLPAAVIVHVAVIAGVGFGLPDAPKMQQAPLLDITLVNTHADKAPDKADFIAQANQKGSGTLNKKSRLSSPLASMNPNDLLGDSPIKSFESTPDVAPKPDPQLLTTKGKTNERINKLPEKEDIKDPKPVDKEMSDATDEIAQLMAEMSKDEQHYANRPRIHFIDSISAKSAVEAKYIDAWAKKLERIGNINFPKEALRLSLSGTLILNTTLDRAGRVVEIGIDSSSGSRILDKAALRIVKLASPYEPLPREIRAKYDQLNITRSIIFHREGGGEITFSTQ
ncbi:MAG TPA: energy transducer TonB [Leucothrix mucor]|uniref:Energy transducer TonB n=1 Tax=Leucothrix mucor TaxID=45248 RepID=A0A7V2WVG1_LEUMU|nr:energy transducer TonB [Leucothrix mucor]